MHIAGPERPLNVATPAFLIVSAWRDKLKALGRARMNGRFGLSFHHLGLAVREPGKALIFHRELGYKTSKPFFDPEQNVNLIMCRHDVMPDVEIIYSGTSPGPLDGMLAKHRKGITYHICFVSADVASSIGQIMAAGIDVICASPPAQAVLFGGAEVSFYLVGGVGLIEIIQANDVDRIISRCREICEG